MVVKAGAQGVILLTRITGIRCHLAAYHQPGDPRVRDVTGAGDAFCGGFLAGLTQSDDPVLAAQMGLVSASLIIEGYGALFALNAARETAVNRLQELQTRP